MSWERYGTLIAAVVLSTFAVFGVAMMCTGAWIVFQLLWKSTIVGA
jgi:hypothetical protein